MKTASLLVSFCVCVAAFTACTSSTDFNTPRTITTPIAADTTRPGTGGGGTGGASALRITAFTPASATSGTLVTIIGSSFRGTTVVSFGGVFAQSYTVVSDSVIVARVGAGATGNVSVTTTSGTATLAGFTFVQGTTLVGVPIIISFTPTSARSGTLVTINGTNFSGATAVRFGGVNVVSFIVVSPTQITATVSTGATGSVSVTTPSGTASVAGFTFLP